MDFHNHVCLAMKPDPDMWPLVIGLFIFLLPLPAFSSYVKVALGGNVYPDGQFNVTVKIGNPLKPYFLHVDTGSNLTWLECNYNNHCEQCNKVPHPLYTPKHTNVAIECHDPRCALLREDVGYKDGCNKRDPHACHYKITYADDSSSDGVLANDMFSFHTVERKLLFGCGYKQSPVRPSPVDGILGLGMGKLSIVTHLKEQKLITKNIIGHCMSIKAHRVGYLFIGDYQTDTHASDLKRVHMIKTDLHYSPGTATLMFHGHHISAYQMKVIFDSGSSYTFMPDRVYHQLVRKVKENLSRSLTEVRDELKQCWKGTHPFTSVDQVKEQFKPLALRFFHANHQLDIPPENYLVVTRKGNVCMGIINAAEVPKLGGVCLIGAVRMQDLLVIYDNDTGHLGWKHKECNIHNERESVINSRL